MAAKIMVVPHLGQGAVCAVSATVVAAATCIIAFSQPKGCTANINNWFTPWAKRFARVYCAVEAGGDSVVLRSSQRGRWLKSGM